MTHLTRTLIAALPALGFVFAAPALAGGCDRSAPPVEAVTADMDIVDTAVAAGSFETLAALLEAADLVEALQGDGPFTVFAPTDDAFAELPAETGAFLLDPENKHILQAMRLYHVVPGRVYAVDAVAAEHAETLQGSSITIEHRDGNVYIDGARVLSADIDATNGVIHVIDAVILPGE